jgi:hypothetical protein
MKFTGTPAGPLGITLLAVTAITGAALAVHGWSGRNAGLTPGALAGGGSSPTATAGPARPGRSAGPRAPSAGPSAPSAAPGSSATPRAPGSSSSPSAGPLLSAQSYAQYSFRVWPGTLDAAARAALTGLSVKVSRQGAGISVTAGVVGQQAGTPRFYPHGAMVYVIEASLGDDSGNSDYSLGDDGLVVTDAQGRIQQ